MAFFKREHKKLAKYNTAVLKDCYRQTEIGLKNATATGNEKAIKTAMKRHQLVEYALLYKNTPEYKNKRRKRNNGKF